MAAQEDIYKFDQLCESYKTQTVVPGLLRLLMIY